MAELYPRLGIRSRISQKSSKMSFLYGNTLFSGPFQSPKKKVRFPTPLFYNASVRMTVANEVLAFHSTFYFQCQIYECGVRHPATELP